MATVREGRKGVLLVVDVQVGVIARVVGCPPDRQERVARRRVAPTGWPRPQTPPMAVLRERTAACDKPDGKQSFN